MKNLRSIPKISKGSGRIPFANPTIINSSNWNAVCFPFSVAERGLFRMRTLKATIVAALVVLGLVGFLATNAIAAVAHTFCTVSVAVFAAQD